MHYKKDYEVSRSTWTKFNPKEDVARQEFKADCDIQTLLTRYGAFAPARPVSYGADVDYDVQASDILHANYAVSEAAQAVGMAPDAFVEASLASNLAPEPSEAPSEGSGSPPSDSAGEGGA